MWYLHQTNYTKKVVFSAKTKKECNNKLDELLLKPSKKKYIISKDKSLDQKVTKETIVKERLKKKK